MNHGQSTQALNNHSLTSGKNRISLAQVSFYLFILIIPSLLSMSQSWGRGIRFSKIMDTATSRQHFLLGSGIQEGVKRGDMAHFYAREKDSVGQFRTHYIGVGEVKQVYDFSSLWTMKKIKEKLYLMKNQDVYFVIFSDYLKGKRQFQTKLKYQVVHQLEKKYPVEKEALAKQEAADLSENYFAKFSVKKNREQDEEYFQDLAEERAGKRKVLSWKDSDGQGKQYSIERDQVSGPELSESDLSEKESDIERELKDLLDQHFVDFDQLKNDQETEKYLNKKYAEIKKVDGYDELNEDLAFMNTMEENEYRKEEREKEYRRVIYQLKEKGPTWSDELSDPELRRYVEMVGLRREDLRQGEALDHNIAHQLSPYYYLNLNSQAENPRSSQFSLHLDYQYYLKNYQADWEKWAMKMGIRISQNDYAEGEESEGSEESEESIATISEKSFLVGLSFYPFSLPSDIYKPVVSLGVGGRLGFASYRNDELRELSEKSQYYLLAFPSAWINLDFRFHQEWGLSLSIIMDRMNYKKYQGSDDLSPESISYWDQKLGFGASLYF